MTLGNLAALVAVVGGVAGGVYVLEDRHASSVELQQVSSAFQSFVIDSQLRDMRKRLWQLEDRYGKGCVRANPTVRAECRALVLEIDHMASQSLRNHRKRTRKP